MYVSAFPRWKKTPEGTVMERFGKSVLEFVAIQRRDNLQWALPGVSEGIYVIFISSARASYSHFRILFFGCPDAV